MAASSLPALRTWLVERGVPTADWDEFATALGGAIDYGWSSFKFSPDQARSKLTLGFCAGLAGDQTGVAYLVDHLADADLRSLAERDLYIIGEAAAPALKSAATNKENLSAEAAEGVLRGLRLAAVIERFKKENGKIASPKRLRTGTGDDSRADARFLKKLGWSDANESYREVFGAVAARERMLEAITGQDAEKPAASSVAIREVTVSDVRVAILTTARPVGRSLDPVPADGEKPARLPAGTDRTFLTKAFRWDSAQWTALQIDGKPSVNGADAAVVSVADAATNGRLGPDQLGVSFYRGMEERKRVVSGWGYYGGYATTSTEPLIEIAVYHLGGDNLEFVKLLGMKDDSAAAQEDAMFNEDEGSE